MAMRSANSTRTSHLLSSKAQPRLSADSIFISDIASPGQYAEKREKVSAKTEYPRAMSRCVVLFMVRLHLPKTTLDVFGQARTGLLAVEGSLYRLLRRALFLAISLHSGSFCPTSRGT